ncbi:DSC E3 ubiquitin ligase complex subunit 1 [Neolecta irregularis DAH-3]|uniref:RING-type E3 ubiquitin transferase n=1 Tax=Neolecta irregularis (strain DAH-3) TaxID=1198029 RepID=A0A1U7LI55_NEOID|nr:DSC E3 ubiquitin ligase complex subunit 1 [Neolecta irregularis DAH-3]|eukprot:OLL22324.1 DSC E3 ubiquitin ligase complex subunit 1 [Neolecta irregularis DAH-3]
MNLSRRDRTILFLIVALFILTPDRSSLNSGWLSDGGLEWELEQRNALFNSSFKHPGNFTGVDFELPEQVSRLVDMLNDGPGPRFSNISSTGKLKWNRLDLENVAHEENDTYPSLITAEAGLLNLFLSSRGEEEEIKQLKVSSPKHVTDFRQELQSQIMGRDHPMKFRYSEYTFRVLGWLCCPVHHASSHCKHLWRLTLLRYPGFAALPLLLPTNALFELSKDLILKVLNETIHEHEEQGMTSPSALDLGAHSSSCEWLLFLQCNTVNLSTEEIKTIESQLRQPSGVPHPPIPKIPSSAILFSPDCGSALSWSAGETIKIEKYYDQARSIAHLTSIITLCQIWVLISQMQRTNSPSSLSKLSIMTILLQTFIDGYLCIIALSLAIFVRKHLEAFIALKI